MAKYDDQASSDHERRSLLLRQLLPASIADTILGNSKAVVIQVRRALRAARQPRLSTRLGGNPQEYDMAYYLFSDLVGFTVLTQTLGAVGTTRMLNSLYQRFDALCKHHKCFKVHLVAVSIARSATAGNRAVKVGTVGDAYEAMCGGSVANSTVPHLRLVRSYICVHVCVRAWRNSCYATDTAWLGYGGRGGTVSSHSWH